MPGNTRTLTIKWVGDTSSVEKSAKKTSGALGKVGQIAAGYLTGSAVQAGAQKLVGFLEDSTKAAMDDQKSQAILAQTMRNTVGAHKEQIAAVETYIGKVADATGVTKDKLRPAYQTLLRGTHNVTQANSALRLAMDVSAGSGKDLGAVSLAMTKAFMGNAGGLGRLGIKVKQVIPDTKALATAQRGQKTALESLAEAIKKHGANSDQARKAQEKYKLATDKVTEAHKKTKKEALTTQAVMKSLAQTFGGDEAKAADTSAGKMARLNERFHEVKVSVGNELLPVLLVVEDWLLNKLPKAIGVAVQWFQKEWPKIYDAIRPFVAFIKQTVTNVTLIVKGLILFFQGFIQFIRAVFTGQWGKAWQGIEKMFSGFVGIIKGLLKELWDNLVLQIRTAGKLLLAAFVAVWSWVINSVETMISRTVSDFAALPGKIGSALWGALGSLLSTAASFGSSVGSSIWGGITGALKGIGSALAGVIKGALNAVLRVWNDLDIGLHIKSYGIGPLKTPAIDINDLIPDVPLLGTGGITIGSGLAYLHPLEAVVPLGAGGGIGGNTYNINVAVAPGGSPADTGKAVVTAIRAYELRNGHSWRAS
jgi:hypothetical protein